MTMIEKFYQTAAKYTGLKEGDSKHKEIINTYNTISPLPRGVKAITSYAWCAIFVSAIAKMLGFSAAAFPYEMSCYYMRKWAEKNGKWRTTPKAGYLIIYDWGNNNTNDHVGFIYNMTANYLDVIEGNKSDTVGTRRIRKNNAEIEGYIDIGISDNTTTNNSGTSNNSNGGDNVSTNTNNLSDSDIERIARDVIRGKYGNGATRKRKLTEKGYDYQTIQNRVNKILRGY